MISYQAGRRLSIKNRFKGISRPITKNRCEMAPITGQTGKVLSNPYLLIYV